MKHCLLQNHNKWMPRAPKMSSLSVTTDLPVSHYHGLTPRDPITATINLLTYPLCRCLLNTVPCNAATEHWQRGVGAHQHWCSNGETSGHKLGNESNPPWVVLLLVQRGGNICKAYFPEWLDPDCRRSCQTSCLCTCGARVTFGNFAEYYLLKKRTHTGFNCVTSLVVDCSGFAFLTFAQTAKCPILVAQPPVLQALLTTVPTVFAPSPLLSRKL